jgi:hypothetical protein
MTADPLEPPPVLDAARVLEYAVLDDSVRYSGHSSLFVDGKELGPVPRLAICQESANTKVLLLHCDDGWKTLGVAEYASTAEAKTGAERIYPGVSKRWIERKVTEEEAAVYLDQEFEEEKCSFCGRSAFDVERMVVQGGARICNFCIKEFHARLNPKAKAKPKPKG